MMFKCAGIFLILLTAACGKEKSSDSLTGPSRSEPAPTPVDLNQKTYVQIARYSADKITVNVYGGLGWSLADGKRNTDPNGAQLRLRVYEGTTFKTWIVGVFNGSPIGNSNNTIIRDIPTPSSIDFMFILEPFGCTTTACWIPLTFADDSHRVFLPDQQYRMETRSNGDQHVVGAVPPVQ